MDLPRGLQEMIDEYVADALDSTGTHKARPKRRALTPAPVAPAPVAASPEPDEDTLIPIEIELDPATQPDALNVFAEEDGAAWQARAVEDDADAALFAQVTQQLSYSESPFVALPRGRAPRSSMAPLPAIDDEDEVTNVVGKPTV